MKRNILKPIAFILILSIYSCSNSIVKNSLTEANLKGPVSKLVISEYEGVKKFGKYEKRNIFSTHIFKYNRNGNIISEKVSYHIFSRSIGIDIYKYDNKEKLIEMNSYNKQGKLKDKYTFKYDINLNIIEKNKFESSGDLDYKFIFKYDKKQNKTEMDTYFSDGSLFDKEFYIYDNKNNMIQKITDFSKSNIIDYKYDSKGNLIQEIHPKNNSSSNTNYYYNKFDKNGNWIRMVYSNHGHWITEREIEYYD